MICTPTGTPSWSPVGAAIARRPRTETVSIGACASISRAVVSRSRTSVGTASLRDVHPATQHVAVGPHWFEEAAQERTLS
jgi:hypothetical protein